MSLDRILEVFKKPRVLLPVVHCIDDAQVDHAVMTAFENMADGVFLINQGAMSLHDVLRAAHRVAGADYFPVGVNILSWWPETTVGNVTGAIASVWSDDALVDLDDPGLGQEAAEHLRVARETAAWRGLYFGGVAFKYKKTIPHDRLGALTRMAVGYGIDVITTSGPRTGEPPSLEKIKAMHPWTADKGLAIASGITPDNVAPFLPYVDAYLVATGIESSFGVFDPAKVRALADAIHAEPTRTR